MCARQVSTPGEGGEGGAVWIQREMSAKRNGPRTGKSLVCNSTGRDRGDVKSTPQPTGPAGGLGRDQRQVSFSKDRAATGTQFILGLQTILTGQRAKQLMTGAPKEMRDTALPRTCSGSEGGLLESPRKPGGVGEPQS